MFNKLVKSFTFGLLRIVLLMLLIWQSSVAVHAQTEPQGSPVSAPQRIVLLYSYGEGIPAYQQATRAFLSVMQEARVSVNNLFFEYLDLERKNDIEHYKNLTTLLRHKYATEKIDLIITVHTQALRFILNEGKYLFPEAPVVSYLAPPRIETADSKRQFLLLPMRMDYSGTLELAQQLFPQTTRVVFINGVGKGEERLELEAKSVFMQWRNKLEFEYTSDLSVEEILQRIAALPPRTIGIYSNVFRDKTGRTFIPKDVARRVAKAANAPVFGMYNTILGSGIIGGYFLRLNPAWERVLGYSREELMAKRFFDFVHPDDFDSTQEVVAKLALQREVMHFENRYRCKDGTYRWLEWTSAPAGDLIYAAARDITERFEVEAEARQHREELAHVGRVATMGELTASLAHEINQPLSAIMSNAQAARRYLDAAAPDLAEVKEILHDIVKEDARAGEIINRLRGLLKKTKTDFELLDLNLILGEVIGLVHSDAVIRDVKVQTELDPRLPLVRGDRIQLQQVALNLLLNAFDAVNERPRGERRTLIRTCLRDSQVVAAVTDSGKGIAGGEAEKVFNPFYTSKPQGLGMGLSISLSIITRHQGRIWVENNPDGGATFYFSLPVPTGEEVFRRD